MSFSAATARALPEATTPEGHTALPKVNHAGMKFTQQLFVRIGENHGFVVQRYATFGYKINGAYYNCSAGSISADVKISGNDIKGLTALPVSAGYHNACALDANVVEIGDLVS